MEQDIKQNELLNEEIIKESIKNSSGKKYKLLHLIKEMWPAYLVEIFVIILGISITLALEQWRDNRKENHLEKIYLKNLLADINVDLQSLNYATTNTKDILNKGNDLISFINGPADNIQSNQIISDIQGILARPNFTSNDATFSDLKSSGNLHLLKDIQLKNSLFAYYSMTQSIKENQDAEQQATITISGSYFLKRFPMGDFKNQGLLISQKEMQELTKNIEFGNNVLLRVSNRKELLDKYQKIYALGIQLKDALSVKIQE